MVRRPTVTGMMLITLLVLFPGLATVQPLYDVTVPRLDFLNEGEPFGPSKELIVRVQNFDREKYRGLKARLFYGTKEDLPSRSYGNARSTITGEPCLIFYSDPRDKLRLSRASIHLGWVPKPGPWVAVFELGDWRDGPIKITQGAVAEYFNRGFGFTVLPPRPVSSGQIRLARLFDRGGRGTSAAQARAVKALEERHQRQRAAIAAVQQEAICVRFLERDRGVLVAETEQGAGCTAEQVAAVDNPFWFLRLAGLLF